MSKNKQMHSFDPAVIGPDRSTAGPVSLAQGVYGARGNLELLTCDELVGLWVFWFNADLDSDPLETPDVPPGSWSAGLHFAAGARYRQADILQSTLGPDHLEVLACTDDGVLESWFWSPGPGFARRAAAVATGVQHFAASIDHGVLRVTVVTGTGSIVHLASDAVGYPDRRWERAADGPEPGSDHAALAALGAAGIAVDGIRAGTARLASSTRAGGTVEVTWRDAEGRIRHLGLPTPRG